MPGQGDLGGAGRDDRGWESGEGVAIPRATVSGQGGHLHCTTKAMGLCPNSRLAVITSSHHSPNPTLRQCPRPRHTLSRTPDWTGGDGRC